MSDALKRYKKLLFEDYIPNPVFAEIATGNWIFALQVCIESQHGTTLDEWIKSLNSSFIKIQCKGDFPNMPIALRSLSGNGFNNVF